MVIFRFMRWIVSAIVGLFFLIGTVFSALDEDVDPNKYQEIFTAKDLVQNIEVNIDTSYTYQECLNEFEFSDDFHISCTFDATENEAYDPVYFETEIKKKETDESAISDFSSMHDSYKLVNETLGFVITEVSDIQLGFDQEIISETKMDGEVVGGAFLIREGSVVYYINLIGLNIYSESVQKFIQNKLENLRNMEVGS